MKFEYVEYLKITDSNSNCVELTIDEVAELYKKLHPLFKESPPISDEEFDTDELAAMIEEDKELMQYLKESQYQFKIDWRGEKYQIPDSITDAELERFEKFLEREGDFENFNQGKYHDEKIRSINEIIFNRYWTDNVLYWEGLHNKWKQELKGENNGENN